MVLSFVMSFFPSMSTLLWGSVWFYCTLAVVAKFFPQMAWNQMFKKLNLFILGFVQMAASQDGKWKKTIDFSKLGAKITDQRRVIFIRHGESTWNEAFNKGLGKIPKNLVKTVAKELSCIFTSDSFLLDAPLNDEGIKQAEDLHKFIDSSTQNSVKGGVLAEDMAVLRGDEYHRRSLTGILTSVGSCNSVIICSNLRRAATTAAIGLKRFRQLSHQKIIMHSSLQEISRNIDCVATADELEIPNMSGAASGRAKEAMAWAGQAYEADDTFDPLHNNGGKSITAKGITRLLDFANFIFTRSEETLVVVGHSLYFKNFFDLFIGFDHEVMARTNKMVNCGAVGFTMIQGTTPDGKVVQWIEPDTINVIYGGFEGGKEKK